MEPVIQIKDLTVSYNSEPALNDVNMEVFRGEFVGILGPNGSGKTTLLRTILGLIKPAKGEVRLFGSPVDSKARRRMGYVHQKGSVDLTFPIKVFDAVMMGRYPLMGLFRLPSRSDRLTVDDALRAVDAWHLKDRPIGELSGGEVQRVWIARALVSKPEILLLDEPTTGLDVMSQGQIIDLIHHIHKERGLTILYVTHEVNNVSCYLDKVAYLKKSLYAYGHPNEVIKVETLRKVYTGEVEVIQEGGRPFVIVGDHCRV
jgi:ABC-type Mn2+/Zn2+ transport system ATPase subunit